MSSSTLEAIALESPVWKQEISARVQAHRSRRQERLPVLEADTHLSRISPRLAGVAANVAERYASAPSYSQYLAKLSEPDSTQSSLSNAEVLPQEFHGDATDFATQGSSALDLSPATRENEPGPRGFARAVFPPELEVSGGAASAMRRSSTERAPSHPEKFLEQAVEPDVLIAPKLIEFPRQLIASRRARPRLAEGPLRDNAAQTDAGEQLRIFEVEPEQISRVPLAAQPAPAGDATAPATEWHYIRLDAPLLSSPELASTFAYDESALNVAPLRRRGLAAALDLGLVALGFLIFAVGFIAVASQPASDWMALLAAAAVFFALLVGYQWLFLTLSDATPGMRYARIALCTFKDENPNLRQRRSRVLASFLGAVSAGLGYAWIWFDHERLGWADRMTHTYQRCY